MSFFLPLLTVISPALGVGWTVGGAWSYLAGDDDDGPDAGPSWSVALVVIAVVLSAAWVLVAVVRAGFFRKGSVPYRTVEAVERQSAAIWSAGFKLARGAWDAVVGPILRVLGVS